MTQIYPVIHRLSASHALEQAQLAEACGADGVFVISHTGEDEGALVSAVEIRKSRRCQDFSVGVNLLSTKPQNAVQLGRELLLDAVWIDNMEITSHAVGHVGRRCTDIAAGSDLKLFGGVAFKYGPVESDPPKAAEVACEAGIVPTTSGPATGVAPDIKKIAAIADRVGSRTLALASGVTPDNIAMFAPYLGHVLVSTGICGSPDHFCEHKLRALIHAARAQKHAA